MYYPILSQKLKFANVENNIRSNTGDDDVSTDEEQLKDSIIKCLDDLKNALNNEMKDDLKRNKKNGSI